MAVANYPIINSPLAQVSPSPFKTTLRRNGRSLTFTVMSNHIGFSSLHQIYEALLVLIWLNYIVQKCHLKLVSTLQAPGQISTCDLQVSKGHMHMETPKVFVLHGCMVANKNSYLTFHTKQYSNFGVFFCHKWERAIRNVRKLSNYIQISH